ncbi:hypothetical protein OLX02_09265 [Novosphingobium sp. KCTC 2891]|uniref:hypothetical protein n=1 Tax=Novosphingobium sp. KCTC 2891 TaxID=2989730 RepID=UPI002222922C|nr:hypothetical protein [Novosphingobium sp. KCTC 2891]MCW1383011.1 hypothetical protein [Novosphingobium sp. KCTC 2891]
MKAERARLARLQRLERIRDIARRNALAEAGKAESTLAQLEALADRTRRLAGDYGARGDAADAGALQQLHKFVRGLERIATGTDRDVTRARGIADARAQEVAEAERRRAAAQDRIDDQARRIARKYEAGATPTGATRKGWHKS